MIAWLYNLLWYCALPFLKKNKRLRVGIEERCAKHLPPKCDIWVHGASAGEIALIITCLRHLSYTKTTHIVITTWTKEGRRHIEEFAIWAQSNLPLLTITPCYFPFDTKAYISRFLDAVCPSLVLIAETELWYMLFLTCRKRNIPLCIINGRISQKTYRYAFALRMLFTHCSPYTILAISEEDRQRFASLFPKSTTAIMHNIKFQSLTPHSITRYNNTPAIVFASIRKKEFRCIAQTIAILQHNKSNSHYSSPPYIYYIVPRHLHHLHYIEEALEKEHIAYTTLSTLEDKAHLSAGVYVINIFGVMHTIYARAQTVLVGGSLIPEYGGHNFLEPLTHGIIPIVGPYRATFAWAEEGLHEEHLIHVIHTVTPQNIATTIEHALHNDEKKQLIQKRFNSWIQAKQDGTHSVQKLIDTLYYL